MRAGQQGVTWYVFVTAGGLLLRRYGKYGTEAEARAAASEIMFGQWCTYAWVAYSERGTHNRPGLTYVAAYEPNQKDDIATVVARQDAVSFVEPPPSPADELGQP